MKMNAAGKKGGALNPGGGLVKFFSGRGAVWAGLAVVAIVFVLLAALTWRKWPDVIVDFGTQLYIPWRLSQGAVLYRDLFYFAGGPLSQYFNALLFKLFGVSFTTLIVANLIFLAALLLFIYRRFLAASDALTATMVCLAVVVVFAFSEYTPSGNYNFIAPYSHETVHGLMLSILAVGFLTDWLEKKKLRPAFLAGLCAGLVFLTKPDIFLALAACAAAALGLFWIGRREINFAAKSVALFLLAMLPPLIFFWLLFLRSEDWRTSLRSLVFGWTPLFEAAIRNNAFYRTFSGLDQPWFHLREMAAHFFCAALVITLYAIVLRRLNGWKSSRINSPWTVWLVLVAPLLLWAVTFKWITCGSSLPLWCVATAVLLAWNWKKISGARAAFPFLWSVFALVLMAKLGFFPRIWHYGFALAMPAFVSAVYLLLWLLPKLLAERHGVPAVYLRAAFVLVLLAGFAQLFNLSEKSYELKGLAVGSGGDKIFTYGPAVDTGDDLNAALGWVENNVPADRTLAVIPEGVTLNYLSRRINPTPCLFWDPNALAIFGQARMTARFEKNPPDYVLIVERNTADLGVGYFGSQPGYGVELMQWIRQNYAPVQLFGSEPLTDGRFGVKIFKRLPAAPPAGI
jgi:hypothetical protein